jgi:hypothetical protein
VPAWPTPARSSRVFTGADTVFFQSCARYGLSARGVRGGRGLHRLRRLSAVHRLRDPPHLRLTRSGFSAGVLGNGVPFFPSP